MTGITLIPNGPTTYTIQSAFATRDTQQNSSHLVLIKKKKLKKEELSDPNYTTSLDHSIPHCFCFPCDLIKTLHSKPEPPPAPLVAALGALGLGPEVAATLHGAHGGVGCWISNQTSCLVIFVW